MGHDEGPRLHYAASRLRCANCNKGTFRILLRRSVTSRADSWNSAFAFDGLRQSRDYPLAPVLSPRLLVCGFPARSVNVFLNLSGEWRSKSCSPNCWCRLTNQPLAVRLFETFGHFLFRFTGI